MTSLELFSISGCEKLKSIKGLWQFTKITKADISRCLEIQKFRCGTFDFNGEVGCWELREAPEHPKRCSSQSLHI